MGSQEILMIFGLHDLKKVGVEVIGLGVKIKGFFGDMFELSKWECPS